jgi:hypothetical protein
MVDYINSAPMFQLAFGLNAVFGYWVWKFLETKQELLATFKIKTNAVDTHICDDRDEIETAVMSNLSEFVGIRSFGVKFVVTNSVVSILTCFIMLICSGVNPQKELSSFLFIILSIWLVLANPAIYFIFNLRYNKVLSDALSKIENMELDEIKDILFKAQGNATQKFFLKVFRGN